MNCKRFAHAPRRQVVSTTVIYGLSLSMHFISPMGDEAAAQAVRSSELLPSAVLVERTSLGRPALPELLHQGSLPSPRAFCSEPALLASLPNCAAS
ncbi:MULTISPECIES: hypothetical protein [unclassified Bradyrhizobium]|uniref:hypothetical protein n=1 Tax=unclassified Bradyrhizobium TaxID=2631580 RepID=UPI0028E8A2B7|nr:MULTISPECIES: hypothetical protein [unclassified Bradyrhizobium]